MKKVIAVTGSKGRIGSRLVALGAVPLDVDVTDPESIGRGLNNLKPDLIIHAASISSIKECEDDYEKAKAVNVWGTSALCRAAGDGKVLFLSTEQVFDGQKGSYSEDDEPNPLNNYGLLKFAAEGVVKQLYAGKVVRLSRGVSRESGKDVDTYIDSLQRGKHIDVPNFLCRSYSHLDFLAEGVWYIANHFEEMPSMLHLGGLFPMSFYELMCMISDKMGLSPYLVVPRKTEIKDNPRPFNCGFNISLAKEHKVPVASPLATVTRLVKEYHEKL